MTGPPDASVGAATTEPLLEVDELTVDLPVGGASVRAVDGVSFVVEPGESVGIVGESGAGKTTVAMALVGLLPSHARVSGSVQLLGRELIGLGDAGLSRLRGEELSVILQDSAAALNPVLRVGWQVAEAVLAHRDVPREEAHQRAVELLEFAEVDDAERVARAYPYELSGGLRQRAAFAIAMANEPAVLVADEPTTALDNTTQAQVLEAIGAARRAAGSALVLITHDLVVAAGHVDRILVMYAGSIVEVGPVDEVFVRPRMPYTRSLLAAQPRLDAPPRARLEAIGGTPPPATEAGAVGCPFASRCPMVEDRCRAETPRLRPVQGGGLAACHFAERTPHPELPGGGAASGTPPGGAASVRTARGRTGADRVAPRSRGDQERRPRRPGEPPVLAARDIVRIYAARAGGMLGRVTGEVHAVRGVSLAMDAGTTLGLVGESGAGKTTVARLLSGLDEPTSGEVLYRGERRDLLARRHLRDAQRDVQFVFQDPSRSLDPRMRVSHIVAEPLRIQRAGRAERARRVVEVLDLVGIRPADAGRYPHELSVGERQRVAIARALASRPSVLILDEPLAALDVSVQAGVINLLLDLQDALDLTYLFVSHDLAVIRHVADVVAVMEHGRIVESGPVEGVLEDPEHPHTQALLAAARRP